MRVRIIEIPKAEDGMDVQGMNPFDFSQGAGEMPLEDEEQFEMPIEVEQGEVMEMEPDEENPEGAIVKVSDQAPTHEEGGVEVTGASRILEDTSDKRNDTLSKLLKLQPDEVEGLTGYKPKKAVTHSRAYEEAQEYWDKQLNKIQSKLEKNMKYVKDTNSTYAKNSLDENLKQLARIPTPQDLFNNLFEAQESLKESVGHSPSDEAAYGLELSDIASPVYNYLDAMRRAPVPYENFDLQISEPRYMSPTPMLNQINEGFQTLSQRLPDNAVGYANLANLFAKKIGAEQQALGQMANINNEIFNKQQQYRDMMLNKKAQMDAATRLDYDKRYKMSLEAQRKQKAVSMADYYDAINKARQFQTNRAIANKLGTFYDIMGDRTEQDYIWQNPIMQAVLADLIPKPEKRKTK